MPATQFGHQRKYLKGIFFLCHLMLFLNSCTAPPYRGCDLLGADEFVLDSYKIREGKFSILEMEGRTHQKLSDELLEEYPDHIMNGDTLTVALYHPKRSDINSPVSQIGREVGYRVENGRITLPDFPPIEVRGLTLEQVRRRVQEAYQKEIPDVEAYVAYKDRVERKVELAGMCGLAEVPVDGRMRLFDVLATARVPTEANLFRSYFIRDGKPLAVDMHKLLVEGDMSQNIVMRGGDKIFIADPMMSKAMVLGEVFKQGSINLPAGYMSLREVLARAGGIPFTGDKGHIQIFRGNLLKPKMYNLNWQHLIRLPTESLLIIPGDIVYVSATPLAEWNRFISQLLPSLTFVDLFSNNFGDFISVE